MHNNKNLTVTMPMDEYLELTKNRREEIAEFLDRAAGVNRCPPSQPPTAVEMMRGFAVKYTDFESLEEVCNAARCAMGLPEVK